MPVKVGTAFTYNPTGDKCTDDINRSVLDNQDKECHKKSSTEQINGFLIRRESLPWPGYSNK